MEFNRVLPVEFTTESVQGIIEGRKRMTRRVAKLPKWTKATYDDLEIGDDGFMEAICEETGCFASIRPRYLLGDLLWVKESWRLDDMYVEGDDWSASVVYKDDAVGGRIHGLHGSQTFSWRSLRYMPKAAARVFLIVDGVKAERLQCITEADAISEGVPDALEGNIGDEIYCPTCKGNGLIGAAHPVSLGYYETECRDCDTAVKRYAHMWDHINSKREGGRYAWANNPWVWGYTFKRVEAPEGWMAA